MISSKNQTANFFVKTVMTLGFLKLTTADISIDFKCTNEDEFFYSTPTTQCSSYYRCYQHQRIKYDCLAGAVFDFYKQKCTRSAGVCYEPVCSGRIDGKNYPDTTHACRRSFNCKGGKLVSIDNCPHGYLFSGDSCQPQEYVNCELPESTAIGYPYGDRRCVGLDNGNHGVEDYDCRKYIICENNEVIDEAQCPHGLKFHTDTKRCRSANDVLCTNDNLNLENFCYRLNNGLHPDPTSEDCTSYLKCGHSKLISKHSCGTQAVFNGDSCVPTPLYQCPKQNHFPSQDLCKNKPDGLFSDPRKDCSTFVKCTNGKTVQTSECNTKGQYFDVERKICVYERYDDNKKCHHIGYSSDCAQMEVGFYQDRTSHSSCREYFYCYNGNRTNFKCSTGKLFNGEMCVDEKTYVCPNSDPNACDLKMDGYYKDKSGCRSYFYCSSGKKFTYLCGEGQLFDGSKCVEKRNGQQCGKDCLGRPDGYYQDITSGCRSYYFCLRGEKATSLTCRGSKLFNGDSCVSPDSYICPSMDNGHASTNCIPRKCYKECKKDGFYADVDAGCHNYYFCIAGKKTSLSCYDNHVFNGEICVRSELYQCPKLCGAMIKCQHGHAANFLQ